MRIYLKKVLQVPTLAICAVFAIFMVSRGKAGKTCFEGGGAEMNHRIPFCFVLCVSRCIKVKKKERWSKKTKNAYSYEVQNSSNPSPFSFSCFTKNHLCDCPKINVHSTNVESPVYCGGVNELQNHLWYCSSCGISFGFHPLKRSKKHMKNS